MIHSVIFRFLILCLGASLHFILVFPVSSLSTMVSLFTHKEGKKNDFPLCFQPPNNPHGITKEELVIALRKCFGATPQFAEYSIPLLLEKMTSDLQSARLDSFFTLVSCS